MGTGFNLSISNLSILLLKLFKPLGAVFNSSISNISTSAFKLAKSSFLVNCNVSVPIAFFKSDFVA